MSTQNWKKTIHACYRGFITQAIIVNISPIFFVIFQEKFNLSYTLLAALIVFNFATQIVADAVAVKYTDKIGFRKMAVIAHVLGALGLISLSVLPSVFSNSYIGLIIATSLMAFGGGICEVVLSPIVDGIPGDAKASAMSLLHSFYCWGQLAVILFTTLSLRFIGDDLWVLLPVIWSLIPIYNLITFLKVPLNKTLQEDEKTPIISLFKSKIFIILMLIMICAGASELAICQWSSLFFEKAIGLDKVLGDLMGPCLFAVTMIIGRTTFGIYGHKLNLFKCLIASAILCILCYLGTALFESPILALISCAMCGLSVSLMWPGTISTGSALFPRGGASMFGILAVMGDIGCTSGPGLLGAISDFVKNNFQIEGVNPDTLGLKVGMLTGVIFPFILLICVIILKNYAKKNKLNIQK